MSHQGRPGASTGPLTMPPQLNTCIVLAGGLGTRLRSAVPDRPKCLAPVGDRSFLDILLLQLARQGVQRVVLSLGYMADMVKTSVLARPPEGLQIDFVIEDRPLGTGGAILMAMAEQDLSEAIVVNGDTYLDADLRGLLAPLDAARGELVRMTLVNVDDRARYGGVTLAADHRVTSFLEKGCSGEGLINAGAYRLARDTFSGHQPGSAFSLETAVLPTLLERGALVGLELQGSLIDIGIPDDYYRFVGLHS